MRFFVTLLMALTLTFAWQGVAFADSHGGGGEKAPTEASADSAKDQAEGKKKDPKEEDEECE